jgi:hypothetical protein
MPCAISTPHIISKIPSDNVSLFCELLSERTDEEIYSFWYFYFEGPHPSNMKKDYDSVIPEGKSDKCQYRKVDEPGLSRNLLSEEDHGH